MPRESGSPCGNGPRGDEGSSGGCASGEESLARGGEKSLSKSLARVGEKSLSRGVFCVDSPEEKELLAFAGFGELSATDCHRPSAWHVGSRWASLSAATGTPVLLSEVRERALPFSCERYVSTRVGACLRLQLQAGKD